MLQKITTYFNPKRTASILLVLTAIFTISMISYLILMAIFNTPIADQLNFMHNTRINGVVGNTLNMYTSWGGRLIQFFALGASYKVFGEMGAQICAPILLLLMLGGTLTWLLSLLFNKKIPSYQTLLFGFLLAGVILYTLYCLFDTFLWLDAAFVYLLGLISIIFNVAFYVWTTRQPKPLKKWQFYILAIIAIFGQTAGETSMILSAGWAFIALLTTLINKKWHQYRQASAIIFIVLCIGALIMIAAPGLWERANYTSANSVKQNLFDMFFTYPVHAFYKLLSGIEYWQFTILFSTAVTIGYFTKPYIKQNSHFSLKLAIVGILVFLSFSYITFVIYFYSSKVPTIESRILTMANLGTSTGIIMVTCAIYYWLSTKMRLELPTLLVATLLLVVSIKGYLSFNAGYISVLSTRKNAYIERETALHHQLYAEASPIIVQDIPVMLARSGASDFTGNNWITVEWFYESYNNYYNIPPDTLFVLGSPLINSSAPAKWYLSTDERQICVAQNVVVAERYWCNLSF